MIEHAAVDAGTPDLTAFENPESIDGLERRLNRGWDLISGYERRGESTDDLFGHFLVLLQEYEDLVDSAGERSAV